MRHGIVGGDEGGEHGDEEHDENEEQPGLRECAPSEFAFEVPDDAGGDHQSYATLGSRYA